MNNEMGKKIKSLRNERGITQEELGNILGVTTQAVSKWEIGLNSPDIYLLPKLSVYFGITIDELFSLDNYKKIERIENMIDNEREISYKDFLEGEALLEEIIRNKNSGEDKLKSIKTLSWLYLFKSDEYRIKAREIALEGLEIDNNSSELYKALNNSNKVPVGDWNIMNHREDIDYFYNILEKEDIRLAYLNLLEYLIEDGRIKEAEEVLVRYSKSLGKKSDEQWRVENYKAIIESEKGNKELSKDILESLEKDYEDNSNVLFELGVNYSYNGDWTKAIEMFEKSHDLWPKPRYTDALDAIGQIYMILKDGEKVIETYNRYIDLLNSEWNITEGELVNLPKRIINNFK